VCAAVVSGVQVTSAWLSAAPDAQAGDLMQVADEVGKQLAVLQLTLGEEPLLDASASGGPVPASDLADGESVTRWPAFASAASQPGLHRSSRSRWWSGRSGPVLGLYRNRPGTLSKF
jgi:hypothetical protein